MKFIAVGSYTAEGLAGFMKNPKDDRKAVVGGMVCLLYTSPSPRDLSTSRMPSSA